VAQGGSYTVTVTGLTPGEQISAILRSTPLTITGIPAADAAGKVTFRVTVPADFATGAHTLTITRADGTTLTPLTLEVVAASSLATTGGAVSFAALLAGAGAVLAGAVMLVVRRRRRERA
ncbi:LPXTG cell wall anchor domain-containing protein, partial [uncultured Microbacterium sp.]|uniref:LPXTG cell wall anchor domain-containing protein n=1 Tax=uncultured Microbacterium sp. TaxID=191216 RepID=UPI0025F6D9C2